MPSQADVEGLRRALAALSGRAKADLASVWAQLDPTDLASVRAALEQVFPELIGSYGDMAAAVAADMFEVWADEMGVKPRTVLAAGVDPDRANARMRWAIGTPSQLGALLVITDELVKQPARSTIAASSGPSGLRYARVPTGSHTCAFCLLLASRGAVYRSKDRALRVGYAGRVRGTQRYGDSYHGDCDCQAVPVRDASDYPAGYDPDALYGVYSAARSSAESTSVSAITAQVRQITGHDH